MLAYIFFQNKDAAFPKYFLVSFNHEALNRTIKSQLPPCKDLLLRFILGIIHTSIAFDNDRLQLCTLRHTIAPVLSKPATKYHHGLVEVQFRSSIQSTPIACKLPIHYMSKPSSSRYHCCPYLAEDGFCSHGGGLVLLYMSRKKIQFFVCL